MVLCVRIVSVAFFISFCESLCCTNFEFVPGVLPRTQGDDMTMFHSLYSLVIAIYFVMYESFSLVNDRVSFLAPVIRYVNVMRRNQISCIHIKPESPEQPTFPFISIRLRNTDCKQALVLLMHTEYLLMVFFAIRELRGSHGVGILYTFAIRCVDSPIVHHNG